MELTLGRNQNAGLNEAEGQYERHEGHAGASDTPSRRRLSFSSVHPAVAVTAAVPRR